MENPNETTVENRQPDPPLTADAVALRICSLLEQLIDDASEEAARALVSAVLQEALVHVEALVTLPDDLRAAHDAFLGDASRAERAPAERVH
jgi:hypothetical protein